MRVQVKAPEFSESVQSGTLLDWRKAVGDPVGRDEPLVDLETDKVILEVAAPAAGVLALVHVPAGAEVKAGDLLAEIDTEAAAVAAAPEQPAAAVTAATATPPPVVVPPPPAAPARATAGSERPFEPPSRRRQAGERGERREPMSRLRQRIAQRLKEAQNTAAILTTFNEIDMQPVQALRARHQERFQQAHGAKLGLMSFFVHAACHALRHFPVLNASIEGQEIVHHGAIDIGVAVSSERGLVVPVLRDADQLGFAEVETRIADFARRANALQLTVEELQGGTFTISNGGIFGSLLSTPILNPPQSGVLGLHRIQERPVAVDGQVVIRPMMYVALSYDHRLVDGREAVGFLRAVKDAMEDPARLLLEV